MSQVLSSVSGATERELDQELLTSSNDQSTDVFIVEWAAMIWGPMEGIMSPDIILKDTSCP